MKKIIISLILFLFLSFIFLAYTETKQENPQSQNWWVIYFTNPKDSNLDFVIENNSNKTNFHYEILSDKNNLEEKDIEIGKGIKKEIPVNINDTSDKKITIRVSIGDDIREIYKTLQ
jgi:hypothetical protein